MNLSSKNPQRANKKEARKPFGISVASGRGAVSRVGTMAARGGMALWATMAMGMLVVAFLGLAMAPNFAEKADATTADSEMAVGVSEVLSIRIVEQNTSTGAWDVDTNTVSAEATHGSFATAMVKVIASTNGNGGYRLTINDTDSDTDLTSNLTPSTIPTLATSETIANITDSGEDFTPGRWGYSWAKNNNDNPSLTFNPVPVAETELDNTSELGVNTYNFTLGVRVTEVTPATTYTDQVMFTLVGNPSPTAPIFFRTTYMQDFDQRTCNTVKAPLPGTSQSTRTDGNDYLYEGGYATKVPTTTIKDKRDEQEYTIRKLADGNCWMTENLRFGITLADAAENPSSPNPWSSTTNPADNTNTTSAGVDVLANETNGLIDSHIITVRTGAKGADDSTAFSDVDEYYQKPYIAIYDANLVDNVSGTGTRFGVLYNYCAATGGTACTAKGTTPTVSGSICPTNWTLPTFTAEVGTVDGAVPSYNNLTAAYSITKNTAAGVTAIIGAPLSFPRAGNFNDGTLNLRNASGNGSYWSSTPNGDTYAYSLGFRGTETIYRSNGTRRYGGSVRCVVAS